MPVPLAAAAFCITMAACHERKRSVKSDQFINPGECGFFVQDEPHSFTLGAIDMSEFVHSSVAGLPSVRSVSVKTENNRVQVEVTVDEFEWKNLEPIYEKELDLSYAFREQSFDFRLIDGSPYAGDAAHGV
jgi:hypothetical protein